MGEGGVVPVGAPCTKPTLLPQGPVPTPSSPPHPSQLPQMCPLVYVRRFQFVLRCSGHMYIYYPLQSR